MDQVPCLLHKYFLVWFQVSLSLGGFTTEGLKCLVIQNLACHSGADARAVSWISILFLNHIHLWAETANLVSGTKSLNLSSPGCLLSVHFSGPRAALPLVALKWGEKGREHRKAMGRTNGLKTKEKKIGCHRVVTLLHVPLTLWHFHALCSLVTWETHYLLCSMKYGKSYFIIQIWNHCQ